MANVILKNLTLELEHVSGPKATPDDVLDALAYDLTMRNKTHITVLDPENTGDIDVSSVYRLAIVGD
jgi:hypothetical protein